MAPQADAQLQPGGEALWEGHVAHSVYAGKYARLVLLWLLPGVFATLYFALVPADAPRPLWALMGPWALTSLGGTLAFAWRYLTTVNERWRLDGRRVQHTTGVIGKKVTALELWRVRDVTYEQTISDRVFGRARYTVYSTDVSDPTLIILGLPPDRVLHQRFLDAVQKARRDQRVVAVDG